MPEDVQVHWKCNLSYYIVVWAARGTVRVHFEDELVELDTGQALWIPIRVAHMVEHKADSLGLAILIPSGASKNLGSKRLLIEVPDTHRQWMFHLMLLTLSPLHTGQVSTTLILDLLTHFLDSPAQRPRNVPLPLPQQPAAKHTAAALLANPDSTLTLQDFASRQGVSERTIQRSFREDTGLSFRQFRRLAALNSAQQASQLPPQPVPALSSRWMNLLKHDVILWAVRGRAIVHSTAHSHVARTEKSQPMQAGQLLFFPTGHALRLEIEQGSLLFPLRFPAGSLPIDAPNRLPLQLPAELSEVLLHRAVSHITALRPQPFDPLDTLRIIERLPNYPGLRYPTDPAIQRIAAEFAADIQGKMLADQIARRHGFSLRQLQRRWTEETGMGLRSWRQAHRFQHARALLNSGFGVKFVAQRLGFSQPGNFSRAYATLYGQRPQSTHNTFIPDIF